MKEEKQTKEQLVEKVATLNHDNERLLLQDQLIRKEFARAFKWYKQQENYSYQAPKLVKFELIDGKDETTAIGINA